jgi:hypothetical protein
LGLEANGTLNVGGELSNKGLELLIKPASESVGDTATDRDDRSHSPRGLVDLHHYVEVGKFGRDIKQASKVGFLVSIADSISMEEEKGLDESHGLINIAFDIISRQREVGCCVGEVGKSASNLLGSFDGAGA